MSELKEYVAWDVPTRWFHWINALSVVGLIGTGLIILFDNALGLSAPGKLTLKSVHASFGYAGDAEAPVACHGGTSQSPAATPARISTSSRPFVTAPHYAKAHRHPPKSALSGHHATRPHIR